MKKLHLMTFICAVLLLGGIFESCTNKAIQNEESVVPQEKLSPIADTLCVIEGKV